MKASYDSFVDYIEKRKSPEQRVLLSRFSHYAYADDMDRIRHMASFQVIRQAALALRRIWSLSARRSFMSQCQEIPLRLHNHHDERDISTLWLQCAKRLNVAHPNLYRRKLREPFLVMTTGKQTFAVLAERLLTLHPEHLRFWMGSCLGAFDNGHALAMTLMQLASMGIGGKILTLWFKRMSRHSLQWELKAHITRDRAGLLATQNLDIAIEALLLGAGQWKLSDAKKEMLRYNKKLDVDWENNEIATRIEALHIFSRSKFFRSHVGKRGGESMSDVDAAVRTVLGGR